MSEPQRAVLIEVGLLYVVTLLAIRGIVSLVQGLGLPDVLLVAVPVLFMYAPVWSCRLRGADPWAYPMALPDWPWNNPGDWWRALRWGGGLSLLVAIPFVVGYHVWQIELVPLVQDALGVRLYPIPPRLRWIWPSNLPLLVAYHLFYVAIPEEMFYRGYMQTRLDEVWAPRWSIAGAVVGPGLLVTCVLFALGHSLVVVQWWHVFIVIPSLGFGWLRARTGGVLAGAFFHAWCNVSVGTLDTLYGIVPP
ncbi:MAG TPA: CPBP family intramembrane metalloprotease [Deltaproteobacteria bacterium]|nr:CPBP family intramembrane metalloprotease [Deltaproteobacteria bacterium]